MTGDNVCAAEAARLIAERERRYKLFPSDIFDEYAWNMLLHLFVALESNRVMTEPVLCELSHAGRAVGKRWIDHLVRDGQVEAREDGGDVVLTYAAVTRLRTYLGYTKDLDAITADRQS